MKKGKPNILLFIMDDQTPGTINYLGNKHISTPNLDKLAKDGVYFRPYTTVPVCTPGRAELLTGRTAFRNGCRWFNEPIHPEITLLPQALNKEGYYCCHIGKWHNDRHPLDLGNKEAHGVFAVQPEVNGKYGCEIKNDFYNDDHRHIFTYMDGDEECTGHNTELLCSDAIKFIDRAPEDQPWFCYVALHSPHDPRTAPEPWAGMYDDMMPPLPENFMPEHPFNNGDMMVRDERLAGFPRKQDEIRRHRADYYAMISHHDHWIGRVIRHLETTGQKENTIIIFTSDHGLAVGSHGLMGKENLYEHSARVPLIFSGPGIDKNKRYDKECLCGHYDFIPTLFELIGLEVPVSSEGISYLDVLKGVNKTVRETICAGYRRCMRMARDERYKLIHYPLVDRYQLFDLIKDPEETNDLLISWRRIEEVRCTPPLPEDNDSEGTIGIGNKESVHNIPYIPALPINEVDSIVLRLQSTLSEWQNEMNDPIGKNN